MGLLHICDFPGCGEQIRKSEIQKCCIALELTPEEREDLTNAGLPVNLNQKHMELCGKHALEIKKLIFPELISKPKK